MILVRDVFRMKFGKAKEVKEQLKAGKPIAEKLGFKLGRVMTDLTGPSYTLVMESEIESLSEFENELKKAFSNKEWEQWYKGIVPLIDSASREIYTIVDL